MQLHFLCKSNKEMKAAKDNPSFHQAMHSKHTDQYKATMDAEVKALKCAKTWTQMLHSKVPEGATVLPLTWAFKLKCYPDGMPCKFKARLCMRGDLQTEGVDCYLLVHHLHVVDTFSDYDPKTPWY